MDLFESQTMFSGLVLTFKKIYKSDLLKLSFYRSYTLFSKILVGDNYINFLKFVFTFKKV